MATVKAVSSGASVGTAIKYVMNEEKTKGVCSGIGVYPRDALIQMQVTKKLWNKTDRRQYKHFVQSFHKDENVTAKQANEIAKEWVRRCDIFKGFEVLIATHQDTENIHSHIIVNSVNAIDGHKFQQSKKDLDVIKKISDEICLEHGLTITEKGKTFEGNRREETSSFNKESFRFLKKAEGGTVKSYVQEIALKVMKAKETAVNKGDFIEKLLKEKVKTDWSDSRKYITFTDLEREQAGEKKCKVRNKKLDEYYNLGLDKESLENEFERNLQRERTSSSGRVNVDEFDNDSAAVIVRKSTDEINQSDIAVESAIFDRKNRDDERERFNARAVRKRAERTATEQARKRAIDNIEQGIER